MGHPVFCSLLAFTIAVSLVAGKSIDSGREHEDEARPVADESLPNSNDIANDEINWEDDTAEEMGEDSYASGNLSRRGVPSWRSEIIGDIQKVYLTGDLGKMRVYGENTEVIITWQLEPLVAAATLGSGRMIVFTHQDYVHSFLPNPEKSDKQKRGVDRNAELIVNMKRWVSGGGYESDDNVCDAGKMGDMEDIKDSCKIIVWTGLFEGVEESESFYENLLRWVESGGGLVLGQASWRYEEIYPERFMNEVPIARILNQVGIIYLPDHFKGRGINMNEGQAENARKAHVLNMVEGGREDPAELEPYKKIILRVVSDATGHPLDQFILHLTEIIDQHCSTIHCFPSIDHPVRTQAGRGLAFLINGIMLGTGHLKAPGVEEFPGDLEGALELTSATVHASVNMSRYRAFPTGYYLPPGQEMTVSWSNAPSTDWQIMIGAHGDKNYNVESLQRWPQLQVIKNLRSSPMKITSPFGGNIYLNSPDTVVEELSIKLEDVVEAPIFTLGDNDVSEWVSHLRSRRGPWADIVGERMVITLPSSSIRNLPDPAEVMRVWDSVVAAQCELGGQDPSRGRGQWTVTDLQPAAGYMHAGYPIVTHLDVADPNRSATANNCFLLDAECVKKGTWGMFHEIGHNMQQKAWTWRGLGEVTTNIFTLYTTDTIAGIPPWDSPWLRKKFPAIKTFLNADEVLNDGSVSPGVGLAVYGQLARDFGWDNYTAVFESYMNGTEVPSSHEGRIDQWILRFSEQVGRNLCPLYDFWGFEIREGVSTALVDLPLYMPDDEITRDLAPTRAQMILAKYGAA